MLRRTCLTLVALLATSTAIAAEGDWIYGPSDFSHDRFTGERIAQYDAPRQSYYRPEALTRSGYRYNNSTVRVGGSVKRSVDVETWGGGLALASSMLWQGYDDSRERQYRRDQKRDRYFKDHVRRQAGVDPGDRERVSDEVEMHRTDHGLGDRLPHDDDRGRGGHGRGGYGQGGYGGYGPGGYGYNQGAYDAGHTSMHWDDNNAGIDWSRESARYGEGYGWGAPYGNSHGGGRGQGGRGHGGRGDHGGRGGESRGGGRR